MSELTHPGARAGAGRRRRVRRLAVGLALVLSALALPVSPAAAVPRGPGLACGATITTDTVLEHDLTGCPDNGVVIGADDVTLDLHGHTIAGNRVLVPDCPQDTPCDRGVDNGQGHAGLTVKNGTVTGFGIGVWVQGADANEIRHLSTNDNTFLGILVLSSQQTRLTDNRVRGNGVATDGAGLAVLGSSDSRVERNTLVGNGGDGLQVVGGSNHNLIAGNRVTAAVFAGIGVDGADNQITRNMVSKTGDGIVVTGDRNVTSRNRVDDVLGCADNGCGFGISFEHGDGNRFTWNVVSRARTGIRVDAFDEAAVHTVVDRNVVRDASADGIAVNVEHAGDVSDTVLRSNVVTHSGDDGIDVESPSTTLTRNRTVRNADLGVEAVPGVTDGGGNRASGNGNPAQCVGVGC